MARKKTAIDSDIGSSLFDKQFKVLQSEFGDKVLQSLDQLSEKSIVSYSTGSLGLDYLISPEAGGMPAGFVVELWGDFSTGKTTLAMGLCANVTANGKRVIFIDAERSLKDSLALNAGVDKEYLSIIRKNDVNIASQIIMSLMKTGEVGAIVIDSVPAWKPKMTKDDVSPDYTNPKLGYHSRFLSEVLPDLVDVCSETGTILVLLNQARALIGSYTGGETPFGGKALEHYDTVRIRLRGKVQQKSARILDSNTNEPIGQYVTCYCDKNKYDKPLKETIVPLILGVGVNPYMELAYLATQKTGVVSGVAGRYKWADTEEPIAHGMDSFVQLLYDDSDIYNAIRSKVIQELKLNYSSDIKVVNPYIGADGKKRL